MGIALIACQALNVWGYDFSSKTQYSVEEALDSVALYYSINPDGKTVSVTVGPEKYKFNHIRIPETVANNDVTYTVTEIAHGAFSGGNIDIVEMANTITKIGDNAFYNCGIDSIKFSKNLKSIGESAFKWSNLTSVYLPEGFETIGDNAFAGNTNNLSQPLGKIYTISLPSTLTDIGTSAFANNSPLNNVVIPENITEIKNSVFGGCWNLSNVVLPEKLTKIGDYAFSRCGIQELNSEFFPTTLTEIGDYAFSYHEIYGRTAVLKKVVLPNNIKILGNGCFADQKSLESITFSSGMAEIPNSVCGGCSHLVKVVIPNSITKIGGGAFSGTTLLSHIDLPSSVTEIGTQAFSASGLISFTFPPNVEVVTSSVLGSCVYLEEVNFSDKTKIIKSSVFSGCKSLRKIDIPNSVETIEGSLGYTCEKLEEINMSGCKVKKLDGTFRTLTYLKKVTLPKSLTEIGNSSFSGCSSLENITLPDSLETIGIQSFYGCTSLSKIELPKSLTNIGSQAFQNCTSLGNITIPHNVSNWGKECFYGCTSLKEVHYKRAVLPSLATSVRLIEDNNQCTLFVPTGSKESYEASSNWNNFSAIVEEEIGYDILYRVSVAKTGKGTVTVNESSATNNDIVSGTDVKLLITPQNGWKIQKVTINDTDITEECLDGEYVIESIAQNTSITVIFEELPAILHLKQADGGSINIPIVKGTKFTCTLSVEDGWSINTVQFNNSNVTSQVDENNNYTSPIIYNDAILSVSYEKYGDSSVSSMIDESSVTAYVTDKGLLIIEGTENMTPISVFASDGRLVTTIISNNGRTTYNLKERGVYLVKTISKTIKVGY